MSSAPLKSRWDAEAEDPAETARLKAEKAARKAAKEAKKARLAASSSSSSSNPNLPPPAPSSDPPTKRRRLDSHSPLPPDQTTTTTTTTTHLPPLKLLRLPAPEIQPSRAVESTYTLLNHIEEGSYGIVSRARHIPTGDVVALKKLKLEREKDGFPITSLREIRTLMACRNHPNIVNLREVVVGDRLDQVYLVMDFLEHDLKTLTEDMHEPFLPSELKTLMHQLLSAVSHLHTHHILHRDLKTSNLLLNNRGQLKIADFGLARFYSGPSATTTTTSTSTGIYPPASAEPLTQLVVTLWYRAPELLLGATTYGPPIDLWSLGCIMGELLLNAPLLQGTNELDQLTRIFTLLGAPSDTLFPGFRRLPHAKLIHLPPSAPPHTTSQLRTRFPLLTRAGADLLEGLLAMDPDRRWTAEKALAADWFDERPGRMREEMFPTFPSRAGQERRRRRDTPGAPVRGEGGGVGGLFAGKEEEEVGGGFMLKLGGGGR